MKVWDLLCPLDISPKFQSAEFRGDSAMGIFLQMGKSSSFSNHHSSLLFGNDDVVRNLSAVVGKIKKLVMK